MEDSDKQEAKTDNGEEEDEEEEEEPHCSVKRVQKDQGQCCLVCGKVCLLWLSCWWLEVKGRSEGVRQGGTKVSVVCMFSFHQLI